MKKINRFLMIYMGCDHSFVHLYVLSCILSK